MIQILRKIFDTSDRDVKALLPTIDKINAFEPEMKGLSDEQLRHKTEYFKQQLQEGKTLDDILPEAFAVVRETSFRRLKMRQF
jgi:preprotein translocase subunit SecA